MLYTAEMQFLAL